MPQLAFPCMALNKLQTQELGQNSLGNILSSKQTYLTSSLYIFPGGVYLSCKQIYSLWVSKGKFPAHSFWSVIWTVFIVVYCITQHCSRWEETFFYVCVRWQSSWWLSPMRAGSTCSTRLKSTPGGSEWMSPIVIYHTSREHFSTLVSYFTCRTQGVSKI